jgi:hypothetical protein
MCPPTTANHMYMELPTWRSAEHPPSLISFSGTVPPPMTNKFRLSSIIAETYCNLLDLLLRHSPQSTIYHLQLFHLQNLTYTDKKLLCV